MQNGLFESLALIDLSGHLIILAIVVCFVLAVATNLFVGARYAGMAGELGRHAAVASPFVHPVLTRIALEVQRACHRQGRDANIQGIVEHVFVTDLKGLLLGERFVKASTGLVIILGLVGTFYGLTLSIGKLVTLVTVDSSGLTDLTLALTRGLTEALAGMSVAFTTSLFGIVAAIALTLLGIVSNLSDKRTALSIQIESHLEHVLGEQEQGASPPGATRDDKLESMVTSFGASVAELQNSVHDFDEALQRFATTTRDFQEFNLHLKDNIQRMSLSFADVSETMRAQVGILKNRPGR